MSPGAWIPAAERDLNVSRRVGRDRREGFKCLPAAGYRLPGEGSRSPSASHAIARSSSSSSGSRPPPSRYGWATVLLDDLLRLTVGPAPVTLSVQKPLGELEATALAALWSSPSPLSAREVLALVQRRPELAYTTVLTVLDRLHDKELVLREKEGKAFLYRPRVSREVALRRIDSGSRSALTIGALSPMIVVDRLLFNALSGEERRAVVFHEQAHVQRRDGLTAAQPPGDSTSLRAVRCLAGGAVRTRRSCAEPRKMMHPSATFER